MSQSSIRRARLMKAGCGDGLSEVAEVGEVTDAATLEMLVEGLGVRDPRIVCQSVDLLVGQGRGRLVHPLLVHHPEPSVRCRVLGVLAGEDRWKRATYAAQIQAASLALRSRDPRAARGNLLATAPEARGWEWRYLHSRLDQDLGFYPMELLQDPAPAFSPDGSLLSRTTTGVVS